MPRLKKVGDFPPLGTQLQKKMTFIPPVGRVSAVNTAEGIYHIQTEFALRPEPRITTTVIFKGRVVHKENYPCKLEILAEESRDLLETILNDQHKKAKESLQKQKGDLIPPDKSEKSSTPDKSQQVEIIRENLSKIKGVKEILTLDWDNLRKPAQLERSLLSTTNEILIAKVLNFALEIQNQSRLGNIKEVKGVWQNSPFLILGNLTPALALFLQPNVDFSTVQTPIQLVLAKYYAE